MPSSTVYESTSGLGRPQPGVCPIRAAMLMGGCALRDERWSTGGHLQGRGWSLAVQSGCPLWVEQE